MAGRNRELTIIQRRILRKLRNKKRSIKRKISPRKNLYSYIQSQTTRKFSIPILPHKLCLIFLLPINRISKYKESKTIPLDAPARRLGKPNCVTKATHLGRERKRGIAPLFYKPVRIWRVACSFLRMGSLVSII